MKDFEGGKPSVGTDLLTHLWAMGQKNEGAPFFGVPIFDP